MRLIDADAMIKHLKNLLCGNCDAPRKEGWCDVCDYAFLINEMKKEPIVDAVSLEDYKSMERTVNKLTKAIADAVPVVRCKDCRWYENDGYHTNCQIMRFCVEAEDYCSRGERREDGK